MSQVVAWKEPTWFDANADRALYRFTCRAYNVELRMLDRDEEANISIEDTVVVLDEQGKIPLSEFDHPEECVYVFGRTHMNDLIDKVPHDYSVVIDYPGDTTMFGATACAIVLADRQRKIDDRID